MKLSRIEIKTERMWRSATGMSESKFDILLSHFQRVYLSTYGQELSTRHGDIPQKFVFCSEEELLLFTLFSLKSGLTYDLLGLTCGMDAATAHRSQTLGLSVLESTLCDLGVMPARTFETVEEFATYFAKVDTLLIDVTEQRIQRPSDEEEQKINYSGKKKAIR
jgi:hypothetical protein